MAVVVAGEKSPIPNGKDFNVCYKEAFARGHANWVALRHTRSLPDLERRRPKHRQLRTKQLIQVNRTETDEGLCATALIEAFESATREKKRLEKEAAERESRLKKKRDAAAEKKKARGIMKRRSSVLQQPVSPASLL